MQLWIVTLDMRDECCNFEYTDEILGVYATQELASAAYDEYERTAPADNRIEPTIHKPYTLNESTPQ